jgi:hypothetical protein
LRESRDLSLDPEHALLIIGGLGNKPPDRNPNVDRLPASFILSHERSKKGEAVLPNAQSVRRREEPVPLTQPPALQSGRGALKTKDAISHAQHLQFHGERNGGKRYP